MRFCLFLNDVFLLVSVPFTHLCSQSLNSDYFSQYVTEDFNTYVNRKRLDCTHGNHIEMQAISEMYNRTIEVFCYGKGNITFYLFLKNLYIYSILKLEAMEIFAHGELCESGR